MKYRTLAPAALAAASLAVLALATSAAQPGPAIWKPRPKLAPRPQPVRTNDPSPAFGDALPGLDAASVAAFQEGRAEFMSVETAEGGLGPIFNGDSCAACHTAGGIGGASAQKVTRFGRFADGRFDPLATRGGSLLQARAIDPAVQETVPVEANVVAQRVTTPVFGAGLIEAIADADIVGNARRPQPDGIHGRAAWVTDIASGKQRVGRFGWKAQVATLLAFAGDAYLNEMGITNRLFPIENAPNGRQDLLLQYDTVPDIEDSINPDTGLSDIDHAADYLRLLAPPPAARATAESLAGARLFEQMHCAACHLPVMFTASNALPSLSHQPVNLYSDLLLHDMGPLGDGIEQGAAGGRDMRTAPLWGLRVRTALLHDGRAAGIADAIRAHAGEAAAARNRFTASTPGQQQQLIEFLKTL